MGEMGESIEPVGWDHLPADDHERPVGHHQRVRRGFQKDRLNTCIRGASQVRPSEMNGIRDRCRRRTRHRDAHRRSRSSWRGVRSVGPSQRCFSSHNDGIPQDVPRGAQRRQPTCGSLQYRPSATEPAEPHPRLPFIPFLSNEPAASGMIMSCTQLLR